MSSRSATLHVVARLYPKQGCEEELREVLEGLVAPTTAEDGCIRYTLTRNQEGLREFVFVEEWRDEEALRSHLASPHIAAARERFRELLGRDLELLKLDPVRG